MSTLLHRFGSPRPGNWRDGFPLLRRFALAALVAAVVPAVRAQVGAASGGIPSLRANARLVSVDVVVTDGHGNPVRQLPASDFTVEDGRAQQKINSFDEHGLEAASKPVPTTVHGFSNAPTVNGASANILLIDWLNTPKDAQATLRDDLVRLLNGEPTMGQTAVFSLGTSLRLLQGFTTDRALLKAAVLRQGVRFSPLLRDDQAIASPEVEGLESAIEASRDPSIRATLEGLQATTLEMEALAKAQKDRDRVLRTMDALADLARYMGGSPARKNLLWLSSSFPLILQRDPQTKGDPFLGYANLEPQFRRTADLLASSHIAVYPIDPGGVAVPPSMLSVMNAQTTDLQRQQRLTGSNSLTPQDDAFNAALIEGHATMDEVAEDTGGIAIYNTNDIPGAVRRAEANGSHFYTLTYVPPADAKPGEFRPITVKVAGHGLHLSYRRGYTTPSAAAEGSSKPAQPSVISAALDPMAPGASQIVFAVQPVAADAATANKVIAEAAMAGAPHAVYTLNLDVDASTLHVMQGADGKFHATLEFATVLYDKAGKMIDSRLDRAVLALDAERYQAMLEGGLRFHHNIALPGSGNSSVRVAVANVDAERVGTVELTAEQIRSAATGGKAP